MNFYSAPRGLPHPELYHRGWIYLGAVSVKTQGSQRVRGGDTWFGRLLNRAIKQLSIRRRGRVRAGDCVLGKVTYRGEHR